MKRLGNLTVRIGDQGERKFLVGLKFFLSLGSVTADTEDLQSLTTQIRIGITEGAGLLGAPGSLGLGVEIDEGDPLRVDVAEADVLTILVLGGDLGSRSAANERRCMGKEGEKVHGEDQ